MLLPRLCTRRESAALVLAGAATFASGLNARAAETKNSSDITGRLQARLNIEGRAAGPLPQGLGRLDLDPIRDAYFYAPVSFNPTTALPLLIMLHGAAHHAAEAAKVWVNEAEARGFLVLAPSSRARTWDLEHAPACADTAFIDRGLEWIFARATVDPKHIALCGFSDGASFALSLGLPNGDLFSHVMCFSAGGVHATMGVGKPKLFFCHGDEDNVLRFSVARVLADRLSDLGYDVTFHEFSGGHRIPEEGVGVGIKWFLG